MTARREAGGADFNFLVADRGDRLDAFDVLEGEENDLAVGQAELRQTAVDRRRKQRAAALVVV